MFVFVYGTLRPSLYPHRSNGKPSRPATLEANFVMWNLGRFPALVPQPQSQCLTTIKGEVIEVEDVQVFDAYEGYRANGKGLYDREQFVVVIEETGEIVSAWTYFMHPERFEQRADGTAQRVPSGDWAAAMPCPTR